MAETPSLILRIGAGKAAGVKGTPTFYVNGHFMGNSPKAVRNAVDALLAGKPIGPGSPNL